MLFRSAIKVSATIASSGVVKRAEIDRRDIELSSLGECIKSRARLMRFPAADGEEEPVLEFGLILTGTL